jgi:polyhydroxybutyrate depolymerase
VAGTTTPVPLVFDFHGFLEGAAGTHPFATQFSAKANANGFVVAYPIGSDNGIDWDVSLQESNPDLKFVDALLTKLEDTLCIDRSRVYITGLSYGAFMTSMLMCMRPNTFAAAAPVAGIRNDCTATARKIPFVTFHGTSDPILPFPGYADTPQAIATKYGCLEPPEVTTLQPDPDPGTGGPITRTTWDCSGVGSAAEFYTIGGGGHSWPGSFFFSLIGFIVGPTATSINATDIIWDFFTQHHL